ncbi:hypothetical protein D3D03_16010 [Exiguobacterium sp. RIT452]|uniref:hypothetical protein n=1 Tax=Exiguobacterium sp. RIT452 TaxID=2315552 RepID=UPI000E74A114|nr:hypothetical protein [Exiguobacterium sp. RIT452]RJO94960.1 hypothetical protein D3D03_16010 [Exiguobacterium sp. RIT452]
MNKIRKASVLYFVIPICLAIVIFILWYGYPFKKFTNQNLKVYQLALTAFAATVGIGTVVNSSRSADTALKSIELATKKESREQSSHLIISSTLTKFGVSPPMYENEFEYSPSGLFSAFYKSIKDKYEEEDKETEYIVIEESAEKTVRTLRSKKLIQDNPFNHMGILNIGKGSCINLEISFEFMNKEDFKDYSVSLKRDTSTPQGTSFYPSYDLNVLKNEKIFSIEIIDNAVKHYLKLFNNENLQTGAFTKANFTFENSKQIRYVNFINSTDEIVYKIPNDYMILCKHYAILHYYKKLNKVGKIPSFVYPNIEHLILSDVIKPLGRLTIKYYDEEVVKENYYHDLKKKEINFDIVIKDESISLEDRNLNFYLEIIPVPVKAIYKTQKKT